jgi:hypothetical protein
MSSTPQNQGALRAHQILLLTRRLMARIEAEIDAMAGYDAAALQDQLEATRNLVNLYRAETARLKADPSLLHGITAAQKSELIAATLALQAHMAEHERAASAAKTVTEGLIGAIAAEIARHKQTHLPYNPDARLQSLASHSLKLEKIA